MKRIVISLFLCFQSLVASIQEYESNGIRVIVCDDFFLPVAKVGIFYSVGLNQFKNVCEAEIVQEKFLNKNTQISAKNLGTYLNVSIYDTFSEVSATVSNNQVTEIIRTILNNEIDTKNLELTKDELRISQKISEYFETNITGNQIYAAVNPMRIFNRSIFDKFTEADLKNFVDMYKKSSKTIVICGKLDTELLEKELNLKKLSFQKKDNSSTRDFMKKDIELRSKFLGRSSYYIYNVNPSFGLEKRSAILSVISHEMFDYFRKHSLLIDNFFFTKLPPSNFLMLGVKVRRDVSKKSFESNLDNFFKRLKKMTFSLEKLKSISQLENFSETNHNENIHAKYQNIVDQYVLCKQSRTPVSEEVLKLSSEDIKNFVEQVFENNSVIKISTQYKAEN